MGARTGRLLLAAGLALAPTLGLAQDRAVPRGDGGGGSRGSGSSDSGSRHTSPGVQSSGSGSSSSSGGYESSGSDSSGSSSGSRVSPPTNAQRRHPRAGTGGGSGGSYYPGYPGYGGGWYYPGYGGYWWPYGSYRWYGGGWGYPGGWGAGGWGGGVYYHDRRDGGSLRVLVDPAEARVYVDGYYAGVVDDFDGLLQRLHVSPGRHEIALKLEGYKTHRMRAYVGPDATLKLHHEMQQGVGETSEDLTGGAPLPERELRRERDDEGRPPVVERDEAPAEAQELGRLQLDVQPADASVYVDGAFRGTAREASSLRLAPGRHRIEVVRPGYRTAERDVDVPAGETTRLEVSLERPSI